MRVVVRCPAKVNLFLAVGPPAPSGYHPIRTIFQAVGLFDTLTISPAKETSVVSDWTGLPGDSTLHRVLRLAEELVDVPPIRVELEKRIPAESGLGGGSSDAAGLIRGLRRLCAPPLSARDEAMIARAVGADVPFFLVGGRARAVGYGDRIEPLDNPPVRWMAIARPNVGVSTAAAYRALDAIEREWRDFPSEPEARHNDFELVAPAESLALGRRLVELGAKGALLCGSGSAVFGEFEDQRAAERAASEFSTAWVAPTLGWEDSLWMSSS